jgi:hypothetical protein
MDKFRQALRSRRMRLRNTWLGYALSALESAVHAKRR